jgi:hypothetical protein
MPLPIRVITGCYNTSINIKMVSRLAMNIVKYRDILAPCSTSSLCVCTVLPVQYSIKSGKPSLSNLGLVQIKYIGSYLRYLLPARILSVVNYLQQ